MMIVAIVAKEKVMKRRLRSLLASVLALLGEIFVQRSPIMMRRTEDEVYYGLYYSQD